MAERDPDILSEDEAARVWTRAAELQAHADGSVTAAEVDGDDTGLPSVGYGLTHVRSAAHEAGIAPEFVEVALADLRVERALPKVKKGDALARRFLNNPPDTIALRRVVEAAPEEVFSAMQAVFPEEPFRLTLTDQQGDPLDGGLLVFDLPGVKNPFEQGFAFETTEAGLRQVFVSLRPVQGTTNSSEITLHSPATLHRLGFGLGIIAAILGGGAGYGALGALGLAVGIGPVGAVAGVLLGAGLGVKGFRAIYAFAMRRARKALEGLVGAVLSRILHCRKGFTEILRHL